MSIDAHKDRLITINKRVAELDAAMAAAKANPVIDLRTIRELRDGRETLWREMQGLVSSAIGA